MKNTLVAYIDSDYLLFSLQKNGNSQLIEYKNSCRYPLYFYIDNHQQKITYSKNYKSFFLDGYDEFVGDFFNSIKNKEKYIWKGQKKETKELFVKLLNDVKTEYFSHTGEAKNTEIPTKLVFSENITTNIKTLLKTEFKKQNFNIDSQNNTFSEIVIKNYISKNSLYLQNKKFAVLEALNDNLNISIVEVVENNVKEIDIKTFTHLGNDPRISTIANEIVNDIKVSYPSASASINTELARHKIKAEKVLSKIETSQKPQLTLSTTFASNLKKRLIANISVEEYNRLADLQTRKILAAFNENFKIKITKLDKIFLIGNNLNNKLVKDKFEQLSAGKNIFVNNDISDILSELFDKPADDPVDDMATMFLAAENDTVEPVETFKTVSTLIISNLTVGQKVKLSNYDGRKGKGASTQIFECVGVNKLSVIESSRSLKVGDIVIPDIKTWHQGICVVLNISRNGRKLGKFKTREIQTIEIT